MEELSFEFQGAAGKFNFAEAALLIQGSACVYSRKVCLAANTNSCSKQGPDSP